MRAPRKILVGSRFPAATVTLIAGCLVGFLVELAQGRALQEFLLRFGVVPLQLVSYFTGVQGASLSRSVLPFLSSLFLHGGFVHLLINISFLWIIGDVVEDALGRVRFVALFIFGAAAELIVRIGFAGAPSSLPSVGLSGAIAALVGGYVVVLSWLARASREPEAGGQGASPALPLTSRLTLLLGALAWFPLQLLNRCLALAPTCQTDESVSWVALLISFALGAFLVSLSGPRRAPASAEAVAFPDEDAATLQI